MAISEEFSVPTTRIDPAEWDEIYIVGDVHGCRRELETLLERLSVTETDLVVFVGDLVRKGPDSKGVVDLVRGRENLLTVRGNNEQKLLDGADSLPALTAEDIAWIESLPLVATLPETVVVHGGISAQKPLEAHSMRELLNLRSVPHGESGGRPYWFETRTDGPRVVFGHTVLSEPFTTDWAVGLDTGCVHGRSLSYLDWRAGEVGTISVETTYVERPPANILSPSVPRP